MVWDYRDFARTIGLGVAIFAAALACLLLFGCAACRTCRADVQPSPQAPSKSWRSVTGQVPLPPPIVPRHDFATPPSDGGTDPTDPGTAPPVPSPSTPVTVPGKARTSSTSETEGGLIITANSGTIVLNSPGVAPGTAPAPGLAPAPGAAPFVVGAAAEPAPSGIGKRLMGGLYYAATGRCPSKAAPASSAFLAVPQTTTTTTLSMVPMQTVSLALPQATPVYLASPAPAPAPSASPQAVLMAPADPAKKCWFFNK